MLYLSNTFVPYNHPPGDARVILFGIPFSSTAISAPSNYGPLVVRESLKLIESRLADVKICDFGDLEIVPGSYEMTAERIHQTIEDIKEVAPSAFIMAIGGDHSITLPLVEILKPKTIIHLDAHADMRKDYLGNQYTHQTWAWHASSAAKIIQIGINSISDAEKWNIHERGVIQLSPEDFIRSKQFLSLTQPIHLTLDIDVLDPSYVETGLPEGKMKPEHLWQVLEAVAPFISSIDIVEISSSSLPSKTGFIAARSVQIILEKKFLRS